jgi:AcrR family transcriptional regulator
MKRSYTLRRRAEQQAETRQRIVEAAVDLHSEVGPAQTTISMLADRAGVQRHTVYAHFPDEWSLLLACSGFALERDPLPDADAWRDINDGEQRLRRALQDLYSWFERNADLAGCILRDAEHHPLTRDIVKLRMGEPMGAFAQALQAGLGDSRQQRAALQVALSFFTWRQLTRDGGLSRDEAVEVAARMVLSGAT